MKIEEKGITCSDCGFDSILRSNGEVLTSFDGIIAKGTGSKCTCGNDLSINTFSSVDLVPELPVRSRFARLIDKINSRL